jgi:membrane-associated phospholipid phosphatase
MLALLFPRGRPVWFALGVGCAYSRLAAGAHFLSDVTVAAILGIMTAGILWRRFPAPITS